jgi:hypothetical protein
MVPIRKANSIPYLLLRFQTSFDSCGSNLRSLPPSPNVQFPLRCSLNIHHLVLGGPAGLLALNFNSNSVLSMSFHPFILRGQTTLIISLLTLLTLPSPAVTLRNTWHNIQKACIYLQSVCFPLLWQYLPIISVNSRKGLFAENWIPNAGVIQINQSSKG